MNTVITKKIEWADELDLGIKDIDEQHRKIVDYINELAEHGESDQATVVRVLDAMIEYTVRHFKFEEDLQKESGYIDLESHKATHSIFEHQIKIYRRRALNGENICEAVSQMLITWLVAHIQVEDKKYVPAVMSIQKANKKSEETTKSIFTGIFK